MAKYHLSEDGNPRVCTAQDGNCPLGKDEPHFHTKIAARAAYEASLDAELIAPSIRKKHPELAERVPGREKEERETPQHERAYEYVYEPKQASQVSIGDQYRNDDGTVSTVIERKAGTKNITLRVRSADGKEKNIYTKLDDTISVNTKRETEASRELGMTLMKEGYLEDAIKRYEPNQPKALAELVLKTQKGYRADSWDYKRLMEASAKDQVMNEYEDAVDRVKTAMAEGREGFTSERYPYTRAFEILKEEYTKEFMRHAGRGESNSTSEVSNVTDRELIRAKAEFIDNIRWGY